MRWPMAEMLKDENDSKADLKSILSFCCFRTGALPENKHNFNEELPALTTKIDGGVVNVTFRVNIYNMYVRILILN